MGSIYAASGGTDPIWNSDVTSPVSVSLNTGESVTVPTGVTWVVQLGGSSYQSSEFTMSVNNQGIHYCNDTTNPSGFQNEMILHGGDAVSTDTYSKGHIGGYEVPQ